MRVLIATRHLGIVGGVETHLRAVLPRLAATGCEVGVFAEHGAADRGVAADVPDAPLFPTAADALRWAPDVVYSHGLDDPAVEVELAARLPTVLFAHNYHGTCVSGTKCHARAGFAACSRTLGPGCLAAYLPRGCGGRNPLTMLRLYRAERARQRTLPRYRAVLVASRHMRDEYRRHGVPDPRVVPLFPPGIDPDPEPPARRAASGRVLFVGRVTRLKGLSHLIAALPVAAAELGRRLTLVVAGDGPDRADAEAAARRAGVLAEFLGWVNADRREAEMRAADVLAVPSVWPEPFGLVGVEAGCVGLPAVGYAAGGIPDWLKPGVTGEAAPADPPAPTQFAAALVRALADDTHRHRLAVGAWAAARRFSPAAHVAALVPELELANRGRAVPC